MDHQDWNPVVFRGKKKKLPTKKSALNSGHTNKKNPVGKYKEDEEGNPIKKTLPKDFGQKMQQARAAKGWSQKELAQKLNIKTSTVQQYEQGKVENPNRAFARKIERVLGAKLF
jgi:putative transcription factor